MQPGADRSRRDRVGVRRRRLLAAVAGGTIAGLAGCQGLRSQSFEAAPVVLPASGQRTLRLGETVRDSATVERSVGDAVDVSLTSHAAVYSRAVGLGGE